MCMYEPVTGPACQELTCHSHLGVDAFGHVNNRKHVTIFANRRIGALSLHCHLSLCTPGRVLSGRPQQHTFPSVSPLHLLRSC